MWETLSESSHGHCLGGFVFKCATHDIRCSSAGGYQTALHCCVRPHAPNRDTRTVTVRYEYIYRATPSLQICTLMDDSTFASRKSSLRAFIWCIYLHFTKNVTFGSHPSICALQVLKFDPARPHVCYAARALWCSDVYKDRTSSTFRIVGLFLNSF